MKSIKRESISALLAVLVISFVTAVTPSSVQVQAQTDARATPLQSTSNVSRGASSKPATLADLKAASMKLCDSRRSSPDSLR